MADPVEEIVDIAIGHDERVANAARQLTANAIIELQKMLTYGTPQVKLQLLRSFIPPLIRQAESTGGNEEIAALRREMLELRRDMGEYQTPDEIEEPTPEIPTDA